MTAIETPLFDSPPKGVKTIGCEPISYEPKSDEPISYEPKSDEPISYEPKGYDWSPKVPEVTIRQATNR